jgi:hypothetical protein
MARVVETVAPDYVESMQWEIFYTKKLECAVRCSELSKKLGRPMPAPSIVINGVLAFESIPGAEDLRALLDQTRAENVE